jgi:hypothetical protein
MKNKYGRHDDIHFYSQLRKWRQEDGKFEDSLGYLEGGKEGGREGGREREKGREREGWRRDSPLDSSNNYWYNGKP